MMRFLVRAAAVVLLTGPAAAQTVQPGTVAHALCTLNGVTNIPCDKIGAAVVPLANRFPIAARLALTTAGYTVPPLVELVRFTQTATVASATIALPSGAAVTDTQPIEFDNYAGAVTALSFSPAVVGWSNGATLAATSAVRIRWDAAAAAWYRVQ